MINRMDEECNKIIETAGRLAAKSGGIIGTEHIICAMASCPKTVCMRLFGREDRESIEKIMLKDGVLENNKRSSNKLFYICK